MTPKTKSPPEPTRRVRKRDPSAFDPRYKDALLSGLNQPVTLEFESNRLAIRFRARAQAYRFAVKSENTDPGLVTLLYRVKTQVDGRKVIIAPVDYEFEAQLASIEGVPPVYTPVPASPVESLASEPSSAPTLDDLMADLESITSHPHDQEI